MGKFVATVDAQSRVTTITVSGKLENGEITAFAKQNNDGSLTNIVLWDFSAASLTELTADNIRQGVRGWSQYSKVGDRQAFVFTNDLEFGFGRMIQTFTELEHYKSRISVFRDIDEARTWLLDTSSSEDNSEEQE